MSKKKSKKKKQQNKQVNRSLNVQNQNVVKENEVDEAPKVDITPESNETPNVNITSSADAVPEVEKTPKAELTADDGVSNDNDDKKTAKRGNNGGFKVYVACILLICILPFAGMILGEGDSGSENRNLASRPALINKGALNIKFLQDVGDYFNDHFAFRQILVSINSYINAGVLHTSTVDDVILGQNDWLYYTATLDDYRHMNSVSERELFNMAHNTKLMQDYCELFDKKFVFTIAPNKNSLYGENMPEYYKYTIAEESDAKRLEKYLKSENVNYVNMFELFDNYDEILYYRKDSHWNNKGAVIAYNALLDGAQTEHRTYDDITPGTVNDYIGDLNGMLYAGFAKGETDYVYLNELPYTTKDPNSTVEDTIVETNNPSGSGSVLMYRDSFGNTLLPYMASEFEKGYFSKTVPYPMTDVYEQNPDVVIVEKVERHLPTLAEVPPKMLAVETTLSTENIDESVSDKATVTVFTDGVYDTISGNVDGEYIDTCSRIFVRIGGRRGEVYEAFTVSTKENDNGFAMYLPASEKKSIDVEVIVNNGNDITQVFEGTVGF